MQGNPPTQPISTPTAQHAGSPHYASVPVILPDNADGADLAYNASGGAVVSAGPFNTSVIRIAIGTTGNFRFWRGAQGSQTGTGVLFVGPGVEYFGINPGEYVNAISNDTSAGTLNITPAL
jgi:hypothetical protein